MEALETMTSQGENLDKIRNLAKSVMAIGVPRVAGPVDYNK